MGLHFIPWSEIKDFVQGLDKPEINSKDVDKEISNFLFHPADQASYMAKENGRARAYVYGQDNPIYIYDGPVSQAVFESRQQTNMTGPANGQLTLPL